MIPFRELEAFDLFMLDGEECEKVGTEKYLTYDEKGEPDSLNVADPNLMVELVESLEVEEEFSEDTLKDKLNAMESVARESEGEASSEAGPET